MKQVFLEIEKSESRLLDLAGASLYLGISRSAIRQLVDSGQLSRVRLPSARLSRGRLDRFLLDKLDLDTIIEQCKDR